MLWGQEAKYALYLISPDVCSAYEANHEEFIYYEQNHEDLCMLSTFDQ